MKLLRRRDITITPPTAPKPSNAAGSGTVVTARPVKLPEIVLPSS